METGNIRCNHVLTISYHINHFFHNIQIRQPPPITGRVSMIKLCVEVTTFNTLLYFLRTR
ncbi:hypothetical protein LEJE111609_01670 [Lelliottia jeotgali]